MPDSQVPDGWRLVRLGEVATIVMGQAPPGSTVLDWNGNNPGGGLPFIQGNAEFAGSHPSPTKWCRQPAKIAEAGDTLISVRAPVGEMNLADRRLAIGRGVAAIRFRGIDPRFGWHQLAIARAAFSRIAQGSTFTAINSGDLTKLGLLIPSVPEQARIAEVLDSIDAAIEQTEAVIEATERLRSALLHELLTRGVPGWHTEWKDVPGIGTIPACWEVVQLRELADQNSPGAIQSGPFGSSLLHSEFQKTGILVIGIDNVLDGEFSMGRTNRISEEKFDELRQYQARPMDVLITVMATVGRSCVVPTDLEDAIITKHVYRITLDASRCLPHFLMWTLLASRPVLRQLYGSAQGQTRPGLNGQILKSIYMPCPLLDEQQKIVSLVGGIGDPVSASRASLSALATLKAWAAAALLSGRVRVPVEGG